MTTISLRWNSSNLLKLIKYFFGTRIALGGGNRINKKENHMNVEYRLSFFVTKERLRQREDDEQSREFKNYMKLKITNARKGE